MDLTVSHTGSTTPPAAPADVRYSDGFYALESDGFLEYRWMSPEARVTFPAAPVDRYLECFVLSEFRDWSQGLTIASGAESATFGLREGWSAVSIRVPAGAGEVRFASNKIFPREYYAPGDGRSLAVRIRDLEFHLDARRHHNLVTQYTNLARNVREMYEGRAFLESTPPRLGIDMHGACNVKPPCVYCDWDANKAIEGDEVDTPFTTETLREWGPFFDNSTTLINCSIGEPFLMRNLDEVLDAFGAGGKELELTTNGQIMPDHIIKKLVGRPIRLHISLDAGTAETYAKLRNNRFDPIVRNMERLVAAKGGRRRLPHLHLVFMPMKLNVHELPKVVELAARLQVDLLVLRPLNYTESSPLNWDRAGYRFEYVNELLPFEELVRTSGRATELCERAGVPLYDQMDFGGSMGEQFDRLFEEGRQSAREPVETARNSSPDRPAPELAAAPAPAQEAAPAPDIKPAAELGAALPSLGEGRKPACTEPWETLYILRRGILPCCYGGYAIAKMDEYREAWNSPIMQGIRTELAHGRFHKYCMESPACPLVRKADNAGDLPALAPPPEPPPPRRSLARRILSKAKRTLIGPRPAAT